MDIARKRPRIDRTLAKQPSPAKVEAEPTATTSCSDPSLVSTTPVPPAAAKAFASVTTKPTPVEDRKTTEPARFVSVARSVRSMIGAFEKVQPGKPKPVPSFSIKPSTRSAAAYTASKPSVTEPAGTFKPSEEPAPKAVEAAIVKAPVDVPVAKTSLVEPENVVPAEPTVVKSKLSRVATMKRKLGCSTNLPKPGPGEVVRKSKAARWQPPKADKCTVCTKTVYQMEKLVADDAVYHKVGN